jgi:hypothetical protein
LATSAKSTKSAGTWPGHIVLSPPRERKTKIVLFVLIPRRGTMGRAALASAQGGVVMG